MPFRWPRPRNPSINKVLLENFYGSHVLLGGAAMAFVHNMAPPIYLINRNKLTALEQYFGKQVTATGEPSLKKSAISTKRRLEAQLIVAFDVHIEHEAY
jgi:hypothetical protein